MAGQNSLPAWVAGATSQFSQRGIGATFQSSATGPRWIAALKDATSSSSAVAHRLHPPRRALVVAGVIGPCPLPIHPTPRVNRAIEQADALPCSIFARVRG